MKKEVKIANRKLLSKLPESWSRQLRTFRLISKNIYFQLILKENVSLSRVSLSKIEQTKPVLLVNMSDFKIVRLLTEHIPGATDVLRQSFFPDEKICNCVRILQDSEEIHTDSKYKVTKGSKELEDLAIDTVKDGVSLCAVDTKTGEVLGVAFNKIQVKPKPGKLSYFEQFAKEHVKDSSAQALVDFMVNVDSRYDLFANNTDCYFELMFLAVKSTAKGKGIGTALVTGSAKLGQDMKLKNENKDPSIDVKSEAKEFKNSEALTLAPKLVSAIFSSRFSQKCGQRAGYEEILQIPYTEFTYKGKKFSEVTGPDHPFCTLSVKALA